MNNEFDEDVLDEATQHMSLAQLNDVLVEKTEITSPIAANDDAMDMDDSTVFLGPDSAQEQEPANFSLITILGENEFGPETSIRAGETRMGRSKDCDIVVNDNRSSRFHAVLTTDNQGCTIKDLGSSNGTKVDGKKIDSPTRLNSGNRIMIGDAVYVFMDSEQGICSREELLASQTAPGGKSGKSIAMILIAGLLVAGAVALYFFL